MQYLAALIGALTVSFLPLPSYSTANATAQYSVSPQYQQRADELLLLLQGSKDEDNFFAASFLNAVPQSVFRAGNDSIESPIWQAAQC